MFFTLMKSKVVQEEPVSLLSTSMGATPDIVTLGKGLGGGFPVAVLLKHNIAETIQPGEHGSTSR